MVTAMVGRELTHTGCPPRHPGEVVLSVRNLSAGKAVQGVSFDLGAGEVLGLAGLMGSGCLEVVEAIFGLRPVTGGEVLLHGKPVTRKAHARPFAPVWPTCRTIARAPASCRIFRCSTISPSASSSASGARC